MTNRIFSTFVFTFIQSYFFFFVLINIIIIIRFTIHRLIFSNFLFNAEMPIGRRLEEDVQGDCIIVTPVNGNQVYVRTIDNASRVLLSNTSMRRKIYG